MSEAYRPGRAEVVAIMEASKEYKERMASILALACDPKKQFGTGEVQVACIGPVLSISSIAHVPETHPVLVSIAISIDPKHSLDTQVALMTMKNAEQSFPSARIPEDTHLDFIPMKNQLRESNKETGEVKGVRKMRSVDWDLLNGVLGETEIRLRQFEVSQ